MFRLTAYSMGIASFAQLWNCPVWGSVTQNRVRQAGRQ
jgi:hypothetical protein